MSTYIHMLTHTYIHTLIFQRPEGRSKTFTNLDSDWNNVYHQSLDVNGTGKPLLQNIIQVCMYVIYVYTDACIYVCVMAQESLFCRILYRYICMYVYTDVHVCMYVCMSNGAGKPLLQNIIQVCMYVYMYVCVMAQEILLLHSITQVYMHVCMYV